MPLFGRFPRGVPLPKRSLGRAMYKVERRRSGVREGEGRAWKWRVLPSPRNLAERSLSDPSRCTGGVCKTPRTQHLKTA